MFKSAWSLPSVSSVAWCLLAVAATATLDSHSRGVDRDRPTKATRAQKAVPPPRAVGPDGATKARVEGAYGQLPLSFEVNRGQADSRVEFLSRGQGYAIFLASGGDAVLALRDARAEAAPAGQGLPEHRLPDATRRPVTPTEGASADAPARAGGAAVRLSFVGGNARAHGRGVSRMPGQVNYLVGQDRSRWRTGISTYAKVAFDDVYPGIDVVYYGNQRQLEYDFVVSPGADPRQIAIAFEGAESLTVDEAGDILVRVAGRDVRQRRPIVYQEGPDGRREIAGRYRLDGPRRVVFDLAAFDSTQVLVIDPVLVYSTYLGGDRHSGSSTEVANSIAVDSSGNAYIAGTTNAAVFPTSVGAFDVSPNGGVDIIVAKLTPTGESLAYSTYVGGSDDDRAYALTLDAGGNAYVTGSTRSPDFPATPGTYDTTFNGGSDIVAIKLDSSGAALIYATYLGGSDGEYEPEYGYAIALDASGYIYIGGTSSSTNFPTTPGAYDTTANGLDDIVVAKLTPNGADLEYATYIGGKGYDFTGDLAVDASGSVHLTGTSSSFNFPTTAGAYDRILNGARDIVVVKLDPTGSNLAFSTYLGGGGSDSASDLALDASGSVYISGSSTSTNFPTTPGAYDTTANGNDDIVVVKLDPTGSNLAFSTYLGGSRDDSASDLALDASGSVYISGSSTSTNFPTTPGAYDTSANGGGDIVIAKLDAGGAGLLYSTYVGGTDVFGGSDGAAAIAVDASGSAYVTGSSSSANFPTTLGVYDSSVNGAPDIVVAKLDPTGASLSYATYIGGSARDEPHGLAVDTSGSAYVTGYTYSTDFPTTPGAYDTSANGSEDMFVAKLDPTGGTLAYSTYLGGSRYDIAGAIAVDASGRAYVIGQSSSLDFPTTAGAYDTSANGGRDLVLVGLNTDGASLAYATYVGGSSDDAGWDVAIDAAGNVYAAGVSHSTNFPATAGAFDTTANGAADIVVLKLDPGGATLAYASYLGGSSSDYAEALAVDASGSAYVSGTTYSSDFPASPGAYDTTVNVPPDVIVAKFDPSGSNLAYATYLGGDSTDWGSDIAVDADGNACVVASSWSGDFPTTSSAHDPDPNGDVDIVLARLDPTGANLTYASYLGGSRADQASGIAVDEAGDIYIAGTSSSYDFPTTSGAYDPTTTGDGDLVVVKLSLGGNRAPVANAGSDQTVEATSASGASVTLDGSGSSDADGDSLAYEWKDASGTVVGTTASVTLTAPLGTSTYTLTVSDGQDSSADTVAVTVVDTTSGSVTVKVPNTNVNWGIGTTQTITWSHTLGVGSKVKIDVSGDGGTAWAPVLASLTHTSATAGTYKWTIPGSFAPTSQARIRVSTLNDAIKDISNVNFTIAPAAILTIVTPTGATNWGHGTTQQVTWTSNLASTDKVNVLLSTDGGGTFPTTLASNVPASKKKVVFTVDPSITTSTARVRVVWANPPSGFAASKDNTGEFTIEPAFLTITFPIGGETWPRSGTNAKKNITWANNLGSLHHVKIELSKDGGATFPIVILASTPSDGQQSVTAQASWGPTTRARIRITSLAPAPTLSSSSPGDFVIP